MNLGRNRWTNATSKNRGAQGRRRAVELLGEFVGQPSAQQLVGVLQADEKACRHPHLKVAVKSTVGNRAAELRSDLAMHGVDRVAVGRAIAWVAQNRDRQVTEGGARPLPRVLNQVAGVHLALDHPVADPGPGQLHDHIRRAGGERPEVDSVGEGGRPVIPAGCAMGYVNRGVGGGQRYSGGFSAHVMQTSENSRTGQDTIDPRNDTTKSAPCMCCKCAVCVVDQIAPTIKYGVPMINPSPISSAIVSW